MATFHKNDITRVKSALSSACISCNQCTYLAKCPGLFAPVFVAYGERPGKTCHVRWHTWTCGGCVEEWTIPSVQLSGGYRNPRTVIIPRSFHPSVFACSSN